MGLLQKFRQNRGSPREGKDPPAAGKPHDAGHPAGDRPARQRSAGPAVRSISYAPPRYPTCQRKRLSGLKQCAVDELHLDEEGITLVCKGEHTAFLYADYNYENIEDTDCLPAVAEYLVQHMRGYYNITRSFYSVPKANGHVEEKTREVTVVRHHEDTPFAPGPVQKQHLF